MYSSGEMAYSTSSKTKTISSRDLRSPHPLSVYKKLNNVFRSSEGPVKRDVPESMTILHGSFFEHSPVSFPPTLIY